jgi:hypothetical protein
MTPYRTSVALTVLTVLAIVGVIVWLSLTYGDNRSVAEQARDACVGHGGVRDITNGTAICRDYTPKDL